MYLTSIEMQGFKSFPDRTKLVFGPQGEAPGSGGSAGVTVIVGPNGSGKSNIADAMRWVLGEISSRTLRGSRMEDVIFGGADSRRPMGYAEVSVTLDNRAEAGRLDCPYDEVTVTRRYFRTGESEYFINRRAVRLKDIYELFLNTGIGRDGYSVIGQGRITEIISRRSEERRGVFEDAAGIAKYRLRKSEAERRLETVEGNLVRIRDIYAEVEAQLDPLEKDAERARRGIALLEDKRRADVGLWLYDTDRLNREIEEATASRNRAAFDLRQEEDNLQSLDAQSRRLEDLSRESRQSAETLRGDIEDLVGTEHRLEGEYRVAETNLANAEERISAAEEARAASVAQAEEAGRELIGRLDDASALRDRLEGLLRDSEKTDAAAAGSRALIAELDGQLASSGEDLRAAERDLADLRARLAALEHARSEDADRNSGLASDIEGYEGISRSLGEQLGKARREGEERGDALRGIEGALSDVAGRLKELTKQGDEAAETLRRERLERDSLEQRLQTYRSMEENLEGYAAPVRFIMRAYAAGRVRAPDGRPCGTIHGPLSRLISVEAPYTAAVETALGAALQHIVVADEATAVAAIRALQRAEAGRATFLPLTAMGPRGAGGEMRRAAGFEGYVAAADELVSCDGAFRGVVSSLIGRVAVFDTVERAAVMAKALGYRLKAVTLDGQMINVGGSFTGGSLAQKRGALTRAQEAKRLEADLRKAAGRVSEAERASEALRAEIAGAEGERQTLEERRDLTRALAATAAMRAEEAQAKLTANETLLQRLREDGARISRLSEQAEGEIGTLRAEETALAARIGEIQAFRAEKSAARADASDEGDRLSEEATRLRIAVSELRKDLETGETLMRLCEDRISSLERDVRAADERAEAYRRKLSEYEEAKRENRRLYEEAERALSERKADRERADQSAASLDDRRSALGETIREGTERKERLIRALASEDAGLERLKADTLKLSGQLWDEYELTRAEAEALGYPPVTEENRRETAALQAECRNKLRAVGHFDPEAVETYREVRQRYEEMGAQLSDLETSKADLTGIIADLGREMEDAFRAAFDRINENFGIVFSELFGGGSAEVCLTDPERALESDIEIRAAPPGKIVKSLMQLSGGEQAFIGIALFFAVLKVNPSPFCILDEIEAALDEINVERFARYIRRYSEETQFILITHRRGTMAAADRLYGVTMPERGISRVLALDVGDISKRKEGDWDGLFDRAVREEGER